MTREDKLIRIVELYKEGKTYGYLSKEFELPRSTVRYWCNIENVNLQDKSIRFKVTDDEFTKHVKESFSISEVLTKCDMVPAGANYKGFHQRVNDLRLDTSHFTGQGHMKGKKNPYVKEISLEDSFIENGRLSTTCLKSKIVKYGLMEYHCNICKLDSWMDKRIVLHLDHINGINNDHRLENLRYLCPNCHSQTETYCGSNQKRKGDNNQNRRKLRFENITNKIKNTLNKKKCSSCGDSLYNNKSDKCYYCHNILRETKIEWPTPEELKKLVWEYPSSILSEKLGVSDVAISKRCKRYGIDKPPRGYWRKIVTGNL